MKQVANEALCRIRWLTPAFWKLGLLANAAARLSQTRLLS